jgi:hypothetical protein
MLPLVLTYLPNQNAHSTKVRIWLKTEFIPRLLKIPPVAETNVMPSEGPKSKYERLENRISMCVLVARWYNVKTRFISLTDELETLLRQKETKEQAILNATSANDTQTTKASNSLVAASSVSQKQLNTYPSNESRTTRSLTQSPPHEAFTSVQPSDNSLPTPSVAYGLDVMWPNWPSDLPGPELLRHL